MTHVFLSYYPLLMKFDCNPTLDTRATFLDISKAFGKVWHEGLIFKLQSYGIYDNLLLLLKNYLKDRKQRVVLNGQSSSWENILAAVPLLFLIYINDLPEGKIFPDDTSIFSKIEDKNISAIQLNKDLKVISNWAYQWKMLFNTDPNKQALEVHFSQKRDKENYPSLTFNGDKVQSVPCQKHLGLILDSKLDFNEHITNKISKCNKIIGVMKKLSSTLSRKTLLTIYKSFVRTNLDYADIIYDKPLNEAFQNKFEMVQYRAALVITGAFKGTSRDRLYEELGLESLANRRWSRRLFFFHKILNGVSPLYLRSYLHNNTEVIYQTRSSSSTKIKPFSARTKNFETFFYLYCLKEWSNLSDEIRNIVSLNKFKKTILNFIGPIENSVFAIHDTNDIKLLTRLRLNFTHLNEHKFRHGFRDMIDPMCKCGKEPETTLHYLLRCNIHSSHRTELLNDICAINSSISDFPENKLLNTLLYGSEDFNNDAN